MRRMEWTDEKVAALTANYPVHGAAWDGWDRVLGLVTRDQLYAKARRLGLTVDKRLRDETDRAAKAEREANVIERELVRYSHRVPPYLCSSTGRVVLRDLLENAPALRGLLEQAGVDLAFLEEGRYNRWTEPEDRVISEAFWAGEPLHVIAARAGRPVKSTGARLRYLGLYVSERETNA